MLKPLCQHLPFMPPPCRHVQLQEDIAANTLLFTDAIGRGTPGLPAPWACSFLHRQDIHVLVAGLQPPVLFDCDPFAQGACRDRLRIWSAISTHRCQREPGDYVLLRRVRHVEPGRDGDPPPAPADCTSSPATPNTPNNYKYRADLFNDIDNYQELGREK